MSSKYKIKAGHPRGRYVSVDVRTVLKACPDIHPETAARLTKVLLMLTEDWLLVDEGDGHSPLMAIAFIRREAELIARTLYPDVFAKHDEYQRELAERGREMRAREKKGIPDRIRKAVFERDAYRCRHCGDHRDLAADHVIPEARGGPTTLENLQTLCRPCNSRKSAKMPEGC